MIELSTEAVARQRSENKAQRARSIGDSKAKLLLVTGIQRKLNSQGSRK